MGYKDSPSDVSSYYKGCMGSFCDVSSYYKGCMGSFCDVFSYHMDSCYMDYVSFYSYCMG